MKKVFLVFLILASCTSKKDANLSETSVTEKIKISVEDSIKIARYLARANKVGLYSITRQKYLDSALIIKPDSAYFWQQKAMPLYKERKFSLGKPFLAKAAEHDPKSYLDYSGFMKCLFSNEYQESIDELMRVKELYGEGYVMDHTYNFYIGLDYLQLNEFDKAKEFLEKSKVQQFKDFPNDEPEEACHYLDWFYLGVADYELENYESAVANFDMSLKVYKNFADALHFKAICTYQLGQKEEAKEIMGLAKTNNQNTINEDQVFYVIYPYQVFHKLSPISSPLAYKNR